MNNKQSKEPEKTFKNKLSENVLDMSKLIIPRGNVILEMVELESAISKSNIIMPDTVDKESLGLSYYVVFKTGDDDFAKLHPEFKSESQTKVGNIIISITPQNTPILTNAGKEYIQVHESSIKTQVEPNNFKLK